MDKIKEPGLEEVFAEIEELLRQMEDKDISLEDSFVLYEQGMQKLKACSDRIDRVEKKMLVLSGQGELTEFE